MTKAFFICSSETPRNNGMVKKCTTRLELDELGSYHCPTCSAPMVNENAGLSVSELLRKGLREESKKGNHA